jgi:single-stranded-DNA-specific exonuclease
MIDQIAVPRETIGVKNADAAVVASLMQHMSLPPAVAQILALRGVNTPEECARYFDPQLSHFLDPFLFTDMEKVTARIFAAIQAKEKIVVYGDYDVDGITATVVLVRCLRRLGAICEYFLPNRLVDGYGLSAESVEKLAVLGAQLIITVDCGITACEEIQLAVAKGMDVIVTDHHEPKDKLPDAYAILDPKVAACGYPDDSLAGVGVALKLCQGLAKRALKPDSTWSDFLDLAAVGTAADIVQLVGENRVIARLGFAMLRTTKNIGLKALIDAQGLSGKNLTTRDVVFQIAPCMNAVGRLGDPRTSVELLLTEEPEEAARYARELKETNMERRAIDRAMQEEAFAWTQEHFNPENEYAVVAGSTGWHCGVVGIVASKVVERYHRPAILFSINSEGMARGSGRSIPSVPLHKVLAECGDLLEDFGGHAAAAGMTIKASNLDAFRIKFNEVVASMVKLEDMVPKVNADVLVSLPQCNYNLYQFLAKMEPFGPGNMRPSFLAKGLKKKFEPRIVGSNHIRMMVVENGMALDAVGFNIGHRLQEFKKAETLSIVFALEENEWNGRKSLQMKIRGVSV